MERKSLDSHQDTPWKTHEFSYTEEVAGSSPVPPTQNHPRLNKAGMVSFFRHLPYEIGLPFCQVNFIQNR